MTYRVYWVCSNGIRHMDIVKGAKSRNKLISSMIDREEIQEIFYHSVSYDGDFGTKKIVK